MAGSFYDKLISGDWMGRSPEDYTYTKKGNSIGWEATLTDGDAFSSFILRVDSKQNHIPQEKQILLAKQVCTNIMNRMLVGTDKKPRITFTNEFNNYAQGEMICVTLEPLKKDNAIKFPSFNHALDPILGYTAHEIAHILYTDEDYGNYILKFKGKELELKSMIMNVLEDERIEKLIAENFRGYTHYVGKAKDYCFGKKFQEELKKSGNAQHPHPVNRLVEVFIHLLRYPKALREENVNEFENEILQFQDILNPYPNTISQLTVCTDEIYKVFLNFFQKSKNPPQQGQGDPQDGEPEDSNEEQQNQQKTKAKAQSGGGNINSDKGDKNNEEQEDKPDGEEQEQDKKSKGGSDKKEDKDKEDDKDGSGSGEGSGEETDEESDEKENGSGGNQDDEQEAEAGDDGEEEDDQQGGGKPEDLLDEMMQELSSIIEAMANSNPMVGTAEEVIQAIFKGGGSDLKQALRNISHFDNDSLDSVKSDVHLYPQLKNLASSEMSVKFNDVKKTTTSSNHYDRALNNVRGFASSLRAELQKLNRNTEITNTGLFEGNFDDGLLVDALIGSKNVYNETFKMQNRGACIGLLIDESGSMYYNESWFLAQQIAVMFERALDGVNNIDFFCYGHTTEDDSKTNIDDTTAINCYFEGRKKGDRKNLGKIYRHNTNRDGHAIIEVVSRMRTQIGKDLPIILFMISDGAPSASVPHGYSQKSYTKKCVDTVEKTMNATVIHIAIQSGIPSKDMFNQFVTFTDFRTLVRSVGNLLKKIVTDKQQPITI